MKTELPEAKPTPTTANRTTVTAKDTISQFGMLNLFSFINLCFETFAGEER